MLAGRAADGEPRLRRAVGDLPKDHSARKDAASWLARALEELGQERMARKEYDVRVNEQ